MAAENIVNLFKQLCHRLEDTEALLSDARETIKILESELTHAKDVGNEAEFEVKKELGPAQSAILIQSVSNPQEASSWIQDIWLTTPDTSRLLGEAEIAWVQNVSNPQGALAITAVLLKRSDLNRREVLLCTLFESALLLSNGRLNEACARANKVIHACGLDWRLADLRSIGHFLRGRYFFESEYYRSAYRDFSVAAFAVGYQDVVKGFRDRAETGMLRERDR